MSSLRDQIRAFVQSNFYLADANDLRDDDSLLDRGVVDSTGVLEVIAFLEERFGIRVEDSELVPDNLDSIARLVAFVDRKTAARRAA